MNIIDADFPKHYTEYSVENKILGINGSPRKNGNSEFILNRLLNSSRDLGITTNAINLGEYNYSSCIGCEKCRKDLICTGLKDGLSAMYPLILSSKGLILVTPVHNYNITAWMKAFIDRLYCFYTFADSHPRSWYSRLSNENRKAVIIAICEQEDKEDMGFALEAMEKPLVALGYEIAAKVPVLGVFSRGAVKDKQKKLDEIDKAALILSESILS